MSLAKCIPGLLRDGLITEDQAARAQAYYREAETDLRRTMSPAAAEAEASERAVASLEYETERKRLNTLRQVDAQVRIEAWLRGGGENWGRGQRVVDADAPLPGEGPRGPINPRAGRTLISMVDARRRSIEAQAFAHMDGLLAQHRATLTGRLRNPAEMDEIGRAIFGEKVDSLSANELADSWFQTSEMLRQRANAAGAGIAKLERWGLPQAHNSRAIAEAGYEQWRADLDNFGLDRERMVDEETGQPFTGASLERALRGVFATVSSDGAVTRTPGTPGRRALANRLGDHRFLHFRDYDGWAAYQEKYGAGTAFDAMMGHIKGMSRTIASMEVMGPNPEAGLRWMKDVISGDRDLFEPGQLRSRDAAQKHTAAIQRLWDEYTGSLRQPENRSLALGFSTYRAVAAASKLGGATLTAVGDVGFGMSARRFNGLPQVGLMRDYLKLINPANEADRRLAARLGFVAETWTSAVAGQNRFLVEELTGEVSRRLADGVLRASGLNAWTDAGRMANGLGWLTHIANERRKSWNSLEPAFRSAMQRYRIGERGWNSIRGTALEMDGGVGWIKPQNLADRQLGDRMLEMILNEGDFAVPVPDLETRALLNANIRRGTVTGELIRSSPLMFKTFTVSTMIRHGGRMFDQPGIGGKLGYFVNLFVPVTLMGALALQLSELSKGRDPQPMDDPRFWGHAIVKGGGLAIMGDLIGVTADERVGGWGEFAAGPLVSDAGRIGGALWGIGTNVAIDTGLINPTDGAGHDRRDDRAVWRLFQSAKQNVPGQSLWYLRTALDRLVTDQVQRHIDPSYDESWRRIERMAREQGQDFWWAPGQAAPSRGPQLRANGGELPPAQ